MFKLCVGKFYIMKLAKPIIINCVDELKNFCVCGGGKNFYISNIIPLKIVETFIEIMDTEIEGILFD